MKKFDKYKKYLIPILILVILIIAILIGLFVHQNYFGNDGLKVEKNTVAWDKEMKSEDESLPIQIPYYTDIYMEQGTRTIDMYLVNPKKNECYFEYVFTVKDTGEEIFRSDLIKPARALDELKLKRKMDAGIYTINIKINTFSLDKKKPLNNAILETRLIVQ